MKSIRLSPFNDMLDKLLICAILSLATWRVSNMLVHEEGPFDVFGRVRRLGLPLSVNPNSVKYFWYSLFSCVYCMSVWVSIVMCALVFGVQTWLDVFTIFAVSGAAIMIEEYVNGES